MKSIIENIKSYFSKKENGEATGESPVGTCPICWGHSEWDGHYYKVIKDKHRIPGDNIYDSFISKIVEQHVDRTHKHEDKYICLTCDKEISQS